MSSDPRFDISSDSQLNDIVRSGEWSIEDYLRRAIARNRLMKEAEFVFRSVSGPDGFLDAADTFQSEPALFCVCDESDGAVTMNNSPVTRRVKTVWMCMRHAAGNPDLRRQCLKTMREGFRQLVSLMLHDRVALQSRGVYINPEITFHEVDSYFWSGGACAWWQVAVDVTTSLIFNPNHWLQEVPDNG